MRRDGPSADTDCNGLKVLRPAILSSSSNACLTCEEHRLFARCFLKYRITLIPDQTFSRVHLSQECTIEEESTQSKRHPVCLVSIFPWSEGHSFPGHSYEIIELSNSVPFTKSLFPCRSSMNGFLKFCSLSLLSNRSRVFAYWLVSYSHLKFNASVVSSRKMSSNNSGQNKRSFGYCFFPFLSQQWFHAHMSDS